MTDVHAVPDGFAPARMGGGFGAGFGPTYIDREGRRMGFRCSEVHSNPVGTCHGGALATFVDTFVKAVRPGADEGQPHNPTISLTVDYLAPIPVGAWVEAKVELVKQTRTMLFIQSIITADGETVARSNAIYRTPSNIGA